MSIRCSTAGLVLLCLLVPLAAADALYSVQYVGGAFSQRSALSVGGVCTGARTWDGDSWEPVPLVVGGACDIPVEGAGRITIRVEDAAWEAEPLSDVPFRWELWGGSVSGPGGEGATCREGSVGWRVATIDVPEGCDGLNVFLSQLATTGTLTVSVG